MFATKLMWNHLPDLEQHAAALPEFAGLTGSELLDRLLGHPSYVWIRRRDNSSLPEPPNTGGRAIDAALWIGPDGFTQTSRKLEQLGAEAAAPQAAG